MKPQMIYSTNLIKTNIKIVTIELITQSQYSQHSKQSSIKTYCQPVFRRVRMLIQWRHINLSKLRIDRVIREISVNAKYNTYLNKIHIDIS